jgi:hypothetical protein
MEATRRNQIVVEALRAKAQHDMYTGSISQFGIANLRRTPAIEGTATTWIGRSIRYLMLLAGIILMTIMIFDLISLLIAELAKAHSR